MRIAFKTEKAEVGLEIQAQADWTGCLITAVIAALPCFLEAFMKCLNNGGNGGSTFQPGDRTRCD